MPQSPIEARLAFALKEASVPFKEQVSIGPFSVDFLIFSESGQPIFVVECDGANYHDAERDTSRDAAITEHTGLKTLRFSGRQINSNLSDCIQNIQHQYASSIESLSISRLGFDSSQQNVVFAPLGPMLVYAPAGSGKTRALIGRIVYLIEKHGFIPSRICALTFTRDAAQEMRTRISQLLSPTVSELLNIGTFHALAGKLKVTDGRNVIEEDRRMATT
ncbi:MAG: DUF559 domain-containing protein [Actinobacteria bacterium]|nr:DUF559 domain-containing protein [Actinomycetota bacterium]